jgi:hypothetical protein
MIVEKKLFIYKFLAHSKYFIFDEIICETKVQMQNGEAMATFKNDYSIYFLNINTKWR